MLSTATVKDVKRLSIAIAIAIAHVAAIDGSGYNLHPKLRSNPVGRSM
jgi:hypothetical protein